MSASINQLIEALYPAGALLDYDPDKRPSAVAALAHEYFSSVPQCSSSEAAAAQARRAADIDALRRTAPSARPVNGVGVTAEQLVSWRRMVSFFDCDCGIGGGEPFGVPPGHATSLPPGTRVSRTAGRGGVAHDVPSMGSLGGAGGAGGAGGGSASSRRVSGRYEPYERVGGRVLGASGGSANAVCRHSSMDVSSCGDESLCVTGGDDALLGGGGHESLENVIDGETPGEGAPIASADKMRGGGLRGAVATPSGIGGDAIEAIRNPNLNMSDSLDASAVYAQGVFVCVCVCVNVCVCVTCTHAHRQIRIFTSICPDQAYLTQWGLAGLPETCSCASRTAHGSARGACQQTCRARGTGKHGWNATGWMPWT